MEFSADIYGHEMTNPNNFGNPLTFILLLFHPEPFVVLGEMSFRVLDGIPCTTKKTFVRYVTKPEKMETRNQKCILR